MLKALLPKILPCNQYGFQISAALILGVASTLSIIFLAAQALASSSISPDGQTDTRIRIYADKVVAYIDTGETEFIGNVKVSQGNMLVTADRMKVYYNADSKDNPEKVALKESIQKIIATGNVRINYNQMVALTQEAVYMAEANVLMLLGNNSRVTSGSNSITGSKFTYYQTTQNLSVESDGQNQIKAHVYAADNSLF